MDISLPILFNESLSTSQARPFVADPQRARRPAEHVDREIQTMTANPVELVNALQLTIHLEDQLEERTNALTDALKELARSKLATAKLHEHVRDLEKELSRISEPMASPDDGSECKPGVGGAFQQQSETTNALMNEIKHLMRN